MSTCPWTSTIECAMAAERAVAGTDREPEACPDHPVIVPCGTGCGMPIILNGDWEHYYGVNAADARGQIVTLERAAAADLNHEATPEPWVPDEDEIDYLDCGCPITYVEDEGDHQPGCRQYRGDDDS